MLTFGLFAPWLDWEEIYEKTGFYIPGWYYMVTHSRVRTFALFSVCENTVGFCDLLDSVTYIVFISI